VGQFDYLVDMTTSSRPTSPYLTTYRLQAGSFFSIFSRITGVFLFFSLYTFITLMFLTLNGLSFFNVYFAIFFVFYSGYYWFFLTFYLLFFTSLFFHVFASFRFLLWSNRYALVGSDILNLRDVLSFRDLFWVTPFASIFWAWAFILFFPIF
jgi:succinate dehydrogenase cytochrome b556 subunit